jgi:hypothetical protein
VEHGRGQRGALAAEATDEGAGIDTEGVEDRKDFAVR